MSKGNLGYTFYDKVFKSAKFLCDFQLYLRKDLLSDYKRIRRQKLMSIFKKWELFFLECKSDNSAVKKIQGDIDSKYFKFVSHDAELAKHFPFFLDRGTKGP